MNPSNQYTKFIKTWQRGFTLIEVLIALVIAAIALGALSKGLGQFVYQGAGLEERIYASWVAQNRLYQIALNQNQTGEKETRPTFMGRRWITRFDSQKTQVPEIYQISISVWPEGQNIDKVSPSARLSTIMGKSD